LQLIDTDGKEKMFLKDENVVGVVPLPGGEALAATAETIYFMLPDGDKQSLMHTSVNDPILQLEGSAELVWALTQRAILRIGPRELRKTNPHPPRVLMSQEEVEAAVVRQFRIDRKPKDFRMNDRWFAKLLPVVTVRLKGVTGHEFSTTYDARYPGNYRYASASATSGCCGTAYQEDPAAVLVLAHWDLGTLLFGQTSNPNSILETPLRDLRDRVMKEVRARYVEGARLARLLERRPVDPQVDLMWNQRLEEYAGYLEFMAGKKVIMLGTEEEQ
jgi:hypothetical protein